MLSVIFLSAISATWAWNALVKPLHVPILPWADMEKQWVFLSQEPPRFFSILINSYLDYLPRMPGEIIGLLGHGDTPMPSLFILLFIAGILFLVRQEENIELAGGHPVKLLITSILTITIILMSFLIYLLFNPVGNSLITAIQGRYFLPLAIPALLLLHRSKLPFPKVSDAKLPVISGLLACISFLATIFTLYHRFYAESYF